MMAGLAHRTAPQLPEPVGIGVDTAAESLVVTGDKPERITSEAAPAKPAGIVPVLTGSFDNRQRRHAALGRRPPVESVQRFT